METAFGVIGLAATLLQTSIACYGIFSDARDCGADQNNFYWQLDTERHRLMRWETIWGINCDALERKLDPKDYRYRYAVGTLARIIALFAGVENLGAKYGIQGNNTREVDATPINGSWETLVKSARRRDRLVAIFSTSRSRSKARESVVKSPTEPSKISETRLITTLDASGAKLLETPSTLQNKDVIPGLGEEIRKLGETAIEMQKIFPAYRKLQWAIIDKARSIQLIEQLRRYNDGLFNVLPEPSQAVLSLPFSMFRVPFRLPVPRNTIFKGREVLLRKIHGILKPDGSKDRRVVVLHGLGGIGKSQLSIEYAYRYHSLYSSVFWIDATSQATLSRSALLMAEQLVAHYGTKWVDSDPDFTQIGVMMGLPGCVGPAGILVKGEEDMLRLVVNAMGKWFSSTGNNNWLVIFENNDEIGSVKLQDFVPIVKFGSIIITTRSAEISYLGVEVEVEQIDKDSGISILLASADRDPISVDREDLVEAEMIVEKLGYLPLALNQAGGYIAAMQMPLSKYLQLYTTTFERTASVGIEPHRNDILFTTWQISFNALPLPASEFLLLCAFLGNQEIVGELIRRVRGSVPQPGKHDGLIHDALKPLLSFSLAKRNRESDRLTFHPLVLEWARENLDIIGRKRKAKEAFVVVGKAFEYDQDKKTSEDWAFEARVMPHVDACLRNLREYLSFEFENCALGEEMIDAMENIGNLCISHYRLKDAEETIGNILTNRQKTTAGEKETVRTLRSVHSMGLVFSRQGSHGEALEFFEKALVGREKVLGEEHLDTLKSLSAIAWTFREQGKYNEALELYGRVLISKDKILGKEHRSTLTTARDIHLVFGLQGIHRGGQGLYGRTLAGLEKALGEDHPDSLGMVRDMASVMHDLKRYSEALSLYEQALAGEEQKLGKTHPDTLITVHNTAAVLHVLSRYDRALPLYERVLVSEEEKLGKNHLDTLATVHNIAVVLHALKRNGEALPLYERALAGREEKLGNNHLDTMTTAHNMALVLCNLERYDEALSLCQRTYTGREEKLGKNHPDTLETAKNMKLVSGGVMLIQYKRELASQEENLGWEHPDTLTTADNITRTLHRLKRHDEALPLQARVLAGREEKLGKDHPDTLATAHNMATTLNDLRRYGEALPLYERALAGHEKILGKDHPTTLAAAYHMAVALYELQRYSEALPVHARVLAGREESLGKDHLDTLSTAQNTAMALYRLKRYDEALPLYERVLAGREKQLGKDHTDTMIVIYNMALLFRDMERYEEALPLYVRTLEDDEKTLGKEHRDTLSTSHEMAVILRAMGQYRKALDLFEQTFEGRKRRLGRDHPETIRTARMIFYVSMDLERKAKAQGLEKP